MAPRAKFIGTGMFVPDRVVTNEDLTKLMDTSDEWIRQRSGVVERRYVEEGQTPGTLAQKASERALEANENASDAAGLIEVRLHAEGRYAKKLWIEAPGSGFTPVRINHEMLDQGLHFPRMEGRFVFKHAVKRLPEVLLETLDAGGLKLQDVDLFLFHQANLRINEYVTQQLEIPAEKCFHNIQRYGNCSAASIPMLLDEAVRDGLLEPGKLVAMTTFGSGFSWSCAVARW